MPRSDRNALVPCQTSFWKIPICYGQYDGAQWWRRDNDDGDNTRYDAILNADTFLQTRATLRFRTNALASLTANKIITQLMHHRAHCDRSDGGQREEFYLVISLKSVANYGFSGGQLDSDVHFSSNVAKRDEIGTSTAAMDDGGVPSQLSE